MNNRKTVKQIQKFDRRFDQFQKLLDSNDYCNPSKINKAPSKPNSRKPIVFNEQVRYAFQNVFQDLKNKPLAMLLTLMVVAISITVLSICYTIYKNVIQLASEYYPSPQITVYLDKLLDNNTAVQVVEQIKAERGVEKVTYVSREEALNEFRNWSGLGCALDMLEENPLPAAVLVIPKVDFQRTDSLNMLRDRITCIRGINEVHMDGGWIFRLTALSDLVARVLEMIGILMVSVVFLVIGNNVRLNIFAHRNTINVQRLIGATDVFILRPFLYSGALFGFCGTLLSLILSKILVMQLSLAVTTVAQVFGIKFNISGLGFDESLLLLLVFSMIGWIAAWLTTTQYLRHFSPE